MVNHEYAQKCSVFVARAGFDGAYEDSQYVCWLSLWPIFYHKVDKPISISGTHLCKLTSEQSTSGYYYVFLKVGHFEYAKTWEVHIVLMYVFDATLGQIWTCPVAKYVLPTLMAA